jgi:hypothetical protein
MVMAVSGERQDIEDKIKPIADRLVRGKSAKDSRAVLAYRIRTWAVVAGATLTSLGVTSPLISMISDHGNVKISDVLGPFPKSVSFIGVGIFILVAIALAFYNKGKVVEKAIQSLALTDAFDRLEIEFQNGLEQPEPIPQLNLILGSAKTLESSFYQIMPKRDGYQQRIDQYARETIAQYCNYWGVAAPGLERSER